MSTQYTAEVSVSKLFFRSENIIRRVSTNENHPKISAVLHFTKQEVIFEKMRYCHEILVDKQGLLWALDYASKNLIKFDWKANAATTYSFGNEMTGPLGLALSPFGDDNILISCQDSRRVLAFDKKTEVLSTIKGLTYIGALRGMTFDSKHNLYITNYLVGSATKVLHKFDCRDGIDNVKQLEMSQPPVRGRVCTIRVNPSNDDLYISFYEQAVIYKIVNDQVVKEYTTMSTVNGGKCPINDAHGLCIYHDHLFIADTKSNTILVVNLKNDTVEALDIELEQVSRITIDPVSNIMYAANKRTIWRLTFDSKLSKQSIFNQIPQRNDYCDVAITTQGWSNTTLAFVN